MARLVRIPAGYGQTFKAKRPKAIDVKSTSSFVDVDAKDIMNMLAIAERVGKSETVGAAVGALTDDPEYVEPEVPAGQKVKEVVETETLVGPAVKPSIEEAAKRRASASGKREPRREATSGAAMRRRSPDRPDFQTHMMRRFQEQPSQPAPGPSQARPPQGPPPSAIPGPETTRGAPGRKAVSVARPTAAGVRKAALRAGQAAGEQAAREIARETPVAPAQVATLDDFISKYGQKQAPATRAPQAKVKEQMSYQDFLKSKDSGPLAIPERVTFRQLRGLARRARTPEDQQAIMDAYERASGRSKPKNLVERYSKANEDRDVIQLVKLFPRAKTESAQNQYYKLMRAEREKALMASQAEKARLLAEKSRLTATQNQELERQIAAGSPEVQIAHKFALAQQATEQAKSTAEKARRTRELLELEKAAIAATTMQKLTAAYRKLRLGRGGKKKGKRKGQLTENQEANLKYRAQQDSIKAQRAMIARIRKKNQDKVALKAERGSLADQIAGAQVGANVSGLQARLSRIDGVLAALKADPESSAATLQAAIGVLRNMQSVSRNELNEVIGRKAAIPAATPSVPPTGAVAGPKAKPADQ
jgi:hypothetical protein